MMIKALLFDIDGTLVDSNDQHVLAWEEVLQAEGATVDRQVIHDQIGKGADMLIPALLPDADKDAAERLGRAHGVVYKAKFLSGVKPFPGARDLIVRAHAAGQKVVLASSASKSELEHYMDLLGVRDLICATTSADDVEHTKPAPDIFAAALEKVAPLGPDEVLAIGDTPYDIEAAAKSGIRTIAVRSGKFADEALVKAGPASLYDDVAALLAGYDQSPLSC